MNHLGTKKLETTRLILRPFVREDAAAMYRNWASDPEVTKFLSWPPTKPWTLPMKFWTSGCPSMLTIPSTSGPLN